MLKRKRAKQHFSFLTSARCGKKMKQQVLSLSLCNASETVASSRESLPCGRLFFFFRSFSLLLLLFLFCISFFFFFSGRNIIKMEVSKIKTRSVCKGKKGGGIEKGRVRTLELLLLLLRCACLCVSSSLYLMFFCRK